MSVCGLNTKDTTRLGVAATVVGLVLYQFDTLKAVQALHAAELLHFVQGVCLGGGLALMIGSRFRRRRAD